MKDLIEALLILQKYLNNPDSEYPTSCEHDMLYVCDVNMKDIPVDDIHKLYDLGFLPGTDDDYNTIKNILGEDFVFYRKYGEISQEDWDKIKTEITNSFYSYRYGSC